MHVSEVGEESELAPETRGREGKRERERVVGHCKEE